MGQILGSLQEKFQGKEWRKRQLRKIIVKIFNRFKNESGKVSLTSEELYIAVLLVYSDINKYLPGRHIDPPSMDEVKAMKEKYDLNLDGELDCEEFVEFFQKLTINTLTVVSQNLIIALVVAPIIALVAKKATEDVPSVGTVVQRVPNSIYATVVTLAVVLFQKVGKEIK
ncbi:PREDICTED: uncharacterized protein LOC104586853 [Nelumbo nucifera]|uniref:EF-hand domain-containing protein n=2 Tax=Nelumbo nucifera TaxID=4432 RepID=A0A822Z314_NELNU|nr:PREDICTED: uncharacterized protein LOC104586853 [Nelumbo nucifera]DAD37835.1 TPA_asm: hypothetical protein HUJ06_008476 [Nelumbo nucifera]